MEVQREYQCNPQHEDVAQGAYENTNQKAKDLKQVHEDLQGLCKALGAIIMKQEKIPKKAKHNTELWTYCGRTADSHCERIADTRRRSLRTIYVCFFVFCAINTIYIFFFLLKLFCFWF